MGKILSYKHGEQSVSGVDPRLWDSVQHAIAAIPYDAVIRSGSESRGASDKGNHMEGYAIDVTLYDPQTGQKLPDTVATSNHGESFAAYEQLAQATRVYQTQTYPELNNVLRWGGGFHQGGTPGDLMHLDITPSAHGSMAYYNWDSGLSAAGQKAFPNAKSNGGLSDSRTTNLYKQSLAGSPGLTPPGAIAPTPMSGRPAALSGQSSIPLPRARPTSDVLSAANSGSRNSGAMANTSTLGWNDGQHIVDGETIRGTLKPADYATARLTAGNVGGIGSVADPNLSALTAPATNTAQPPALQRALTRLNAAMETHGKNAQVDATPPPSNKVRVITVNPDGTQKFPLPPDERSSPVIYDPPSPMPGRPSALTLNAAAAPTPMPARPADVVPASGQQAPVQTIRVGKHDYQVGQTFDQGGMHYVVTPTGIQSSRIQSGEPTVMSGIVGNVIRSAVPEVQAGINTAAGKVGQNFSEMGTNLKTSASKVGASLGADASQIGNSLSATFGGLGSLFSGGSKPAGSSAFLGSTGSGALTAPFASEDHPRSNSSKPLMDNIGYGPTQGGIDAMSRTYVPPPKNGYIESSPVQSGANYTTAMTGWNGPLGKNITVAPLPRGAVTLPASLSRTTGGNVLQSHGNALNANVFSGSTASGNVTARVSAVPTMTLAQYNQRQQQLAAAAKAQVATATPVRSNALQAPVDVHAQLMAQQSADQRGQAALNAAGMGPGQGGSSGGANGVGSW